VAVLALIVLLVGYQITFSGRIFPGVHVMGVDLSGQTPEQAQTSLTSVLDEFDARPITLQFQEQEWRRRGGEFGLKRDVTPLVSSAYELGREGNLLSQLVQQL
jgi:hypothetical protein